MVRNIKLLALLLLLIATYGNASAQNEIQRGGITYSLNETSHTATIRPSDRNIEGELAIPASLDSAGVSYRVTIIGSSAFNSCEKLTKVTVPEGVISIEGQAFFECVGLTTISLPSTLKEIIPSAFDGCRGLKEFQVPPNSNMYKAVDGVLFSKSLNRLILYPRGLDGAYTIPDETTEIAEGAFRGANLLTMVTIPNTVSKIGGGAFGGSKQLASIQVKPGSNSFTSIDGVLYSADIKTLVAYPNAHSNTYDVHEGVITIGDGAFLGCDLTRINLPDGLTTIGNCAFYGCNNLLGMDFPNSLIYIGSYAFYCCYSLTNVVIPEGVTKIDNAGFIYCSITTLSLPSTIQALESSAFYGCNGLTRIICLAVNPPETETPYFSSVFAGVSPSCVVYVPAGSVEAYKASPTWSNFAIKPIPPTGVTITTPAPLEVTWGETLQLAASVQPKEAAQDIVWSLTPDSLGYITPEGVLVPSGAGRVTVRAASKADEVKYAETMVTIKYATPEGITIIGAPSEMTVEDEWQLKASVTPTKANAAVTWSVNPANRATITPMGLLTATGEGLITVRATSVDNEKLFAEVKITLSYAEPTKVTIMYAPKEMMVGESHGLIAGLLPRGGRPEVVWSVDNEALAIVNPSTTRLEAKAAGIVTVRATSVANRAIYDEVKVTIKEKPIPEAPTSVLTLAPSIRTATEGLTLILFNAEGLPLELYNLAGVLAHRKDRVAASTYRIVLPQRGFYILRVGNTTRKVVAQ